MKKFIAIFTLLISVALGTFAQLAPEVDAAYERCGFTCDSIPGRLQYRLLLPQKQSEGQQYPLVVFLHGLGERGDDNTAQLLHGGAAFANAEARAQYPAYVIFPQCDTTYFWAYENRPNSFVGNGMQPDATETQPMRLLMALLDTFTASGDVDPDRIYIAGLSMGAMATYDLVCRHPERFAAATAICGAVEPGRLASAKHVPWHIYHGGRDMVVPTVNSHCAVAALRALGAEVVYDECETCTHNSWDYAFASPDFFQWMFAQKRK